ncbi:MAG: 2-oxoacid:ferredoxin oxidoreductase subunit beta [Deltaproteobacteria bacterium]|nr:MAG: 2-oxoacid:ferredoxin oxidoreductase subunit beta [Deltaproteobacteria bacterium]
MDAHPTDYDQYLRRDKFPLIWCPGCGHGIIFKSILRSIAKLAIPQDDIVMVSGIGCSSRTPGYADFNTLHTTHGRAIAFATGVKMFKPKLTTIVVTGDGDATAIGGNHFIHAARRNIDITVILFNNYIYGMTGGQASPTTPAGRFASTTPYGNPEPNFNISGLAQAAGASFVARASVTHVRMVDKYIQQALKTVGFSVVEVMTPCPIAFGRRNKMGNALKLMQWMKDNTMSQAKAAKLSEEELENKVVTGVLVDRSKPEYTAEYQKLIERVQAEEEARKRA